MVLPDLPIKTYDANLYKNGANILILFNQTSVRNNLIIKRN